jgi:(5-formylfuran-3-yl)methyl phosphate synthase
MPSHLTREEPLQLLVSVRSPDEVAPALAGGAQIIDAKEPSQGSLGPVDPWTLRAILECVPADIPVSVALGDFCRVPELLVAVEPLNVSDRGAPMYLKLGFAGLRSGLEIARLIETAVLATAEMAAPWQIVAVTYADSERAGTIAPMMMPALAKAAGAAAVLVDTWRKDGRSLLHWLATDTLVSWVDRARELGLLTALAGSLRPNDLPLVCQVNPDIIGTRGAVCAGGRSGSVSEELVEVFRRTLVIGSFGDSQESRDDSRRETPETGAIPLT